MQWFKGRTWHARLAWLIDVEDGWLNRAAGLACSMQRWDRERARRAKITKTAKYEGINVTQKHSLTLFIQLHRNLEKKIQTKFFVVNLYILIILILYEVLLDLSTTNIWHVPRNFTQSSFQYLICFDNSQIYQNCAKK